MSKASKLKRIPVKSARCITGLETLQRLTMAFPRLNRINRNNYSTKRIITILHRSGRNKLSWAWCLMAWCFMPHLSMTGMAVDGVGCRSSSSTRRMMVACRSAAAVGAAPTTNWTSDPHNVWNSITNILNERTVIVQIGYSWSTTLGLDLRIKTRAAAVAVRIIASDIVNV